MGDMADYVNECGEAEWDAHERGDCDGGCPYCEEPDRVLRDLMGAQRKAKLTEKPRGAR